MAANTWLDQVEDELRVRAIMMTMPHYGECMVCYVARMCHEFGCDTTLRWARHYRDLKAPRATGLERRLGAMGGYCDCEVLLNGYKLVPAFVPPEDLKPDEPRPMPTCRGVRGGSTQACELWQRQSWGRW